MNEAETAEAQAKIERRAKLYERTLNRLTKWRTVFVGWIWGTKGRDEPGVQGMRDLMDQRLIQRVEISALASLLISKGIITADEFKSQVVIECDEYQALLEKLFPGYIAVEDGISVNTALALGTNKRMGFPP